MAVTFVAHYRALDDANHKINTQHFLQDRKISVLGQYLRSKTRNLYKSSDYYSNGVWASAARLGSRIKRPVRIESSG